MYRRGITAQPVLNGYCGDYEYGMDNSVVFSPEFNYFQQNDIATSTVPISTTTTASSTQRLTETTTNSQKFLRNNLLIFIFPWLLIKFLL